MGPEKFEPQKPDCDPKPQLQQQPSERARREIPLR